MVRLVFRPYTQVRRTICTSVSLRASTRVSSASPYPGIVHHLSGPDSDARLKPFTEDQGRLAGHALHFHCARGFATRVLASVSDSLVRVSRRVGCARSVRRDRRRVMTGLTEASPEFITQQQSQRTRATKGHRFETADSGTRHRAQTGFLSPISSTL